MSKYLQVIEASSADAFLNHLRPSNDKWLGEDWVFRGHSDYRYDLTPTLYRKPAHHYVEHTINYFKTKLLQTEKDKKIRIENLAYQQPWYYEALLYHNAELKIEWDFCVKANLSGLPLSELVSLSDYQVFREVNNIFKDLPKEGDFKGRLLNNHPPSLSPTLNSGLAQHHGMPTRLLDFTFDPLKALFFASINSGTQDICVWAIRLSSFKSDLLDYIKFRKEEKDINSLLSQYSVSIMPSASNAYLYNQKGLFLYPKYANEYLIRYGRHPDLKDFMEAYYGEQSNQLIQIVLPRDQVEELKVRLRKEGVTLASLMPTYDNVANELLNGI